MIARSGQVALALTVVLAAGAAWQAREHRPPESGHPGASVVRDRGFTLVASGDVLPHGSVIDRARFDAARTGHRPDIDLIPGTHAHAPQAYEKINGTWVISRFRPSPPTAR
ncbi:hypothetical protein GCM10027073_53060 [Streptomyces chlorus]